MKIKFNTQWNRGKNNELSFSTGLPTDNQQERFTEDQVRKVLKTLTQLPETELSVMENFRKEAAKDSVLIEVLRGVHDVRDPHLMIDFLNIPVHVCLERDSENNWRVRKVPVLKKLDPDNDLSLEETLGVLDEYREIHDDDLLENPDVNGVGTGYARIRNRFQKELAVGVTVSKKLPVGECNPETFIGSRDTFYSAVLDDWFLVRIDVLEGGRAVPESCEDCNPDALQAALAKITAGVSISNASVGTSGTLGGFFFFKRIATVALSNRHVMEDPAIVKDKNIIQPGRYYGGSSPGSNFALRFMTAKVLDAAIAKADSATSKRQIEYEIACTGSKVRKIAAPILKMKVRKVGATTGCTQGTVTMIKYKDKDFSAYGSNNVVITGTGGNFTEPGDSGSLYEAADTPGTFVGLHWGGLPSGKDKLSIGHPLPVLADELSLSPTVSAVAAKLVDDSLSLLASYNGSTGLPAEVQFPSSVDPRPLFCNFYESLARAFAPFFSEENQAGQKIGYLLADAMLSCDGWRAALVAMMGILKGKLTAVEALHHRLTSTDIENILRFLRVAGWVMDSEAEFRPLVSKVGKMEGSLLADLAKIDLGEASASLAEVEETTC